MSALTLSSCVCGECVGCPDGYHGDNHCDCTASCVLGETVCTDCGYESVDEDGYCHVCGEFPHVCDDEFCVVCNDFAAVVE